MANSTPDSSTPVTKAKVTSSQSFGKKILRQKSFDKDRSCAEISFKDFLGFLRTAYQVNDSVEGSVANELRVQKYLDWQEVAKNEMVTSLLAKEKRSHETIGSTQTTPSMSSFGEGPDGEHPQSIAGDQTTGDISVGVARKSKSLMNTESKPVKNVDVTPSVDQMLKRKLNELIQEGLLDSVLPYVVPKTAPLPVQSVKKEVQSSEKKKLGDKHVPLNSGFSVTTNKERLRGSRRKSSTTEFEVEIHVCDEVKNLKRDFRCPQKLLVSKMGYFAQVTTGQKLEDMDISVHCDISIFDWLMRWVKQGPADLGPTLDAGNVVPILVSAAFLQMDPLLENCLVFCHQHMRAIIQMSTSLSCINDNLLDRLAKMFSNSDIECLKDRRDKISSRLYCKLIQSLADASPEPARGHYATLSGLYRCEVCSQLVTNKLVAQFPCSPSHMQVGTSGILTSSHSRDPNWNLSEYILSLWSELQCWRLVYWRLWGDCHFLYCTTCDTHFPARQARWCCHHPEEPQYFTKEGHRMLTFPIGRYPCCGERSYRFQAVPQKSGCQFKDHQADLSSERDRAVHALYIEHLRLITVEPPKLVFPHRLTKLVTTREMAKDEEPPWWNGMEIVPARPRQGLLVKWEQHRNQKVREKHTQPSNSESMMSVYRPKTRAAKLRHRVSDLTQSETGNSSSDDGSEDTEESETESSEDSGNDAWSNPDNESRNMGVRGWELRQSTRANQDNQRDMEENQARHMANFLARRTHMDTGAWRRRGGGWNNNAGCTPIGGSYVKVEQDFKDNSFVPAYGYEKQNSASSRYKVTR